MSHFSFCNIECNWGLSSSPYVPPRLGRVSGDHLVPGLRLVAGIGHGVYTDESSTFSSRLVPGASKIGVIGGSGFFDPLVAHDKCFLATVALFPAIALHFDPIVAVTRRLSTGTARRRILGRDRINPRLHISRINRINSRVSRSSHGDAAHAKNKQEG